uniref:NADH-ubiquinone oxidoreductase chain 5 n=1 Tax=Macoma balthica TaxID=1903275 RepID=A0A0B4U4W4_MACBL|nr:NADH deshydrogenase subunit 5 [Macoma balthica]AJC10845.1 NADH deshydrogenase subunit 5 [Macoma balthica]
MSYSFKVYSYFNGLVCLMVWIGWVGWVFIMNGGSVVVELDMLTSGVLNISIPFMLDVYSVLFSLVVIMISSCVMLYNGFYMDAEQYYNRFSKLVLLFVISMLFLVMIPNFLGLMLGWDGLGLTSYLLVIYYQDKRSLGSGTLTVLSNRVGDVLFFIAISLSSALSSWGFVEMSMGEVSSVFCGIVVVGCMTKSAQMPFSAWLPAAMAAPSPVSALVHSSTLVTAGVYVLIRFSGCIVGGWYLFLGIVSSLTMLMSAISAVFEPDVKKVVALSTLSQLGVMMLAISVGAVSVCFFHLVSHALFKALMFLCVGSVIHFSGIQDLRYLGAFAYKSPIIMGWLIVACLSLMGFPFLSGFYSKDLVIESFLSGGLSLVLFLMVVISTCLTAIYGGWMVYSLLKFNMGVNNVGSMISNEYVTIPCSILGFGAMFGGMFMQCVVISFNEFFTLFSVLKLIPILCVSFGIFSLGLYSYKQVWGQYQYFKYQSGGGLGEMLLGFLSKMWFMPPLSSDVFSDKVLSSSGEVKEMIEDGYLEYSFGGDGVWHKSQSLSLFYVNSQFDYIGVCFVKGFLFLIIISLMCFMISI